MTSDIEKRLNTAVTNAVPDVLDSILSQCEERTGKVIDIKSVRSSRSRFKPMLATAAALVLIVGGALGANGYHRAHSYDGVVSLDVNPSIEMEVSKNETVLAVTGLNSDGESVIERERAEGTKLEGAKLDELVFELVGFMVGEGYLSEEANSVLVTVDNPNADKGAKLEKSLMTRISDAMSENGVEGAVIGQSISSDEELAKLALELGVSKGKAGLIASITAKNPEYTADELAKLSINDLGLLSKDSMAEDESVSIVGEPSDKKYVGAEVAIENACAEAKLQVGETVDAQSKIGLEDGKLIYKVELNIDTQKIECAIDAVTGEILSWLSGSSDSGESSDGDNKSGDETDDGGLGGEVGAVIGGVGEVVGGAIGGAGEVVGGAIGGAGEVVGGAIGGVGEVVGGAIGGVGNVVGGTVDGVADVVGGTVGGAGKVVDGTLDGVGEVVDGTLGGVSDIVGKYDEGAASEIDDANKQVSDAISDASDIVNDSLGQADSIIKGIGDNISGGSSGGSSGGGSSGGIGGIVSGLLK